MRRSWGDYWRNVCAPKLMQKKKELGRELPEHAISAYVESASGKRSGRGFVSHVLSGRREPYISQFFALCRRLDMDPFEVLKEEGQPPTPPLARINEKAVRKRTPSARRRGGGPQ